MQSNSKDVFDMMLLEPPPLPSDEVLAQPAPTQPRLAMLDTSTVLQLTSEPNLMSVKVVCRLMDVLPYHTYCPTYCVLTL